ncbi:crossover junction endonuclease EME1 isoform X1 [Heteronotia binoei]|uniref:crossover junction endonuclease EME1 isoform X1 n=1 Tax=Heteronotia binoei TaxID=13085 RepID=UPI00292FB7E7|nr:crossover junction endonuclease EME1 isoform X1 [Heteronotia binoei]
MKVYTMFPEVGDSEDEELRSFSFLKKPLPLRDEVVVLCSSDSEDSSTLSPAWKKACSGQDLARAATQLKKMSELSNESEEEEDLMPLAERLRKNLLNAKPSTAGASFTRLQEPRSQVLVGHKRLYSSDEQVATDCLQPSQPRDIQRRAVPSTWELSDSDQEMAPRVPKKQSVNQLSVCLSQYSEENGSHLMAEMSLKSFPLQTETKHSQEELDKDHQAAIKKRKDQETQKRLREQERERKKALANLRKAQRPEECLKHIQVVLDPGLLQVEGGGQLLTILQSMDCSYIIANQVVPCSITWRRKTGIAQADEDNWIEEPNILVLVLLEDFVSMIQNYKQVSMDGSGVTLQSFVANVKKKIPGKTLAMAIVELEKYFSYHKQKQQKRLQQAPPSRREAQELGKQRHRQGKGIPTPELSRVDVEEALVRLQLPMGIQIRVLESWKEFADFVVMFTKAVAEAPFKRERDKPSFSFCLEGDWIGGKKVDCSGKGLLQVWKRQLQQFNRVSLEMANAIVAKYPSPLLLVQAYNTTSSEQERQNLLAEIPVRRGDGVTATTRRVGPELSKRIYLQMTSYNPDLSLDEPKTH